MWCQKILPLVYDDSLSYYEMLCKVRDYINELIKADNLINGEIDELKSELADVQKWIDEFDVGQVDKVIEKYLGGGIYPRITSNGYIVYETPRTWKNVKFNTTGLDITLPEESEYGHLVLSF